MNGGGTALGGWKSEARVEDEAEFSAVSVLTRSLASLDAYGKESDHQRDGAPQKEQLIIPKGDDVENWDWVGRPKRQILDPVEIEVKGSIPEEFKTYSGERQSPISIHTRKSTPWRFPPLQWHHHWNRQSSIKLTNTGHSVQMSFGTDTKINGQHGTMPYLTGGPLASEYEFVQLHFHWGCKDHLGCEHIIDGKSYAMEAHLVHYNKSYGSVEEACKHGDGLAVVGIFMQAADSDNLDLNMLVTRVQEVCSEKDNCTMIEEQRPLLWVKEAVLANSAKSVSGSGGYFTYLGSLTTPTYDENVTWILFPDPVSVSQRQIAEFRQLMSPKGKVVENYRELQSISDRTIFHAE